MSARREKKWTNSNIGRVSLVIVTAASVRNCAFLSEFGVSELLALTEFNRQDKRSHRISALDGVLAVPSSDRTIGMYISTPCGRQKYGPSTWVASKAWQATTLDLRK